MARWRLMTAHYIRTKAADGSPGSEWEYKETDRTTGKQARKVYAVPTLLNPEDGADHNYPGEIVVCYEGKGQHRDIIFLGQPTPEMEPLDDEAKAISDKLRPSWGEHPINSLSGQLYTDNLLADLQKQVAQLGVGGTIQANVAVPPDEFAALKAQVAELMKQNAELQRRRA